MASAFRAYNQFMVRKPFAGNIATSAVSMRVPCVVLDNDESPCLQTLFAVGDALGQYVEGKEKFDVARTA